MSKKELLLSKKQEIIDMYEGGMGQDKIAEIIGVSGAYISVMLKEWNVLIRKPRDLSIYNEKIKELHATGYSSYKIAVELKVDDMVVLNQLKKLGLKSNGGLRRYKNGRLTDHAIDIIEKYQSGTGCHLLSKEYNCAETSILRLLRQNGVEIRPLRTISMDEDYFEKIDTEDKAYF